MPATTQKETFDQLYGVFGKDAQGQQLLDWADYYMNYSRLGQPYYMWADLVPYVDTDRIPYWTKNNFASNTKPDGYLPAGVSSFYFRMRPFLPFGSEWTRFLDEVARNRSTNGDLKETSWANDPEGRLRVGVVVSFFDGKLGKYRRVFVAANPNYFKVRYYSMSAPEFEGKREALLAYNKTVRELGSTLSHFYNNATYITKHEKFSQLRPELQKEILFLKSTSANQLNELTGNPLTYGKLCAECQKNAQIGVLPVWAVVAIVGAALAAAVYTVSKIISETTRRETQRIQAKRALEATQQYIAALQNPNLSQADRDRIFQLTKATTDNANAATTAATKDSPGFFDRVENLIFLAGGFLILNNVTKKG